MEVLCDWQIKMNANRSLRHISEHCDILVLLISNTSTEPKLNLLAACSTQHNENLFLIEPFCYPYVSNGLVGMVRTQILFYIKNTHMPFPLYCLRGI